jgi:hypothetical protein
MSGTLLCADPTPFTVLEVCTEMGLEVPNTLSRAIEPAGSAPDTFFRIGHGPFSSPFPCLYDIELCPYWAEKASFFHLSPQISQPPFYKGGQWGII